MSENAKETLSYSWYALALLTFVYVLNFLDRQIIYILFPLIKKEMAFSDVQLALLGGTSFAIFYTVLGIPFGRLADKGSRTKMIAIGLAIWSLFSGLTGFAWDFWSLFFCRVMVGVGEATLGPAAISLLSDYFPPQRRATVTSIYSMGIAVGAGLAAILGGLLSSFGWRSAYFIIGFPRFDFRRFCFSFARTGANGGCRRNKIFRLGLAKTSGEQTFCFAVFRLCVFGFGDEQSFVLGRDVLQPSARV
jgi:MFS family permease